MGHGWWYAAAAVAALLTTGTTGGTFIVQQNGVGGELNTIGSNVNYVKNQITYNSNKIDALNTGLGSLVDADLAGVGAVAGAANSSAAGHAGLVVGEPGAADAAQPVQVMP